MKEIADQFFEKNQIALQYVICQSVEEQPQAVISGQTDVMLNCDLESIPNMSIVAEFSPYPLYFASGDQALLQELDQAILYVKQANGAFSSELYKKYMVRDSQERTLEEMSFIEEADPFVVAIFIHNAPYQ